MSDAKDMAKILGDFKNPKSTKLKAKALHKTAMDMMSHVSGMVDSANSDKMKEVKIFREFLRDLVFREKALNQKPLYKTPTDQTVITDKAVIVKFIDEVYKFNPLFECHVEDYSDAFLTFRDQACTVEKEVKPAAQQKFFDEIDKLDKLMKEFKEKHAEAVAVLYAVTERLS